MQLVLMKDVNGDCFLVAASHVRFVAQERHTITIRYKNEKETKTTIRFSSVEEALKALQDLIEASKVSSTNIIKL